MTIRRVTATEFSRNLSSLLNEVRYRDLSIEVVRGKEIIARVIPPEIPPGFPIERLNGFFASLPKLHENDREDFLEDVRTLDSVLTAETDPWAS
jgi:hypothetical protein